MRRVARALVVLFALIVTGFGGPTQAQARADAQEVTCKEALESGTDAGLAGESLGLTRGDVITDRDVGVEVQPVWLVEPAS